MKLSEVKSILNHSEIVNFEVEGGEFVPAHFHVTELGIITKLFIDCGGTVRTEKRANFQLWNAYDTNHRLSPKKLLHIIQLSEEKLGMDDLEVEVEYQGSTIGKYDLTYNGTHFLLAAKNTACLAEDFCGMTPDKLIINKPASSCCDPKTGCC